MRLYGKVLAAMLVAVFSYIAVAAQSNTEIFITREQAGSQQWAYPIPANGVPQLSATPEGYTPFHIEHYGRHGSRWLIRNEDYDKPVRLLEKADKYGKLTPRGKEIFDEIRTIRNDSRGRVGELTPLGHRQHREIAARMVHNFPEIFTAETNIDARSTTVIRCILSMANEVAEIQRLVPGINVAIDASQTTQDTLNYAAVDSIARNTSSAARYKVKEYRASQPKSDYFFDKMFNDRQFVADSLGEADVFSSVYEIVVNIQSHDDYATMYDIFSAEELQNELLAKNVNWYVTSGNTPLTNNRVPFTQRHLLANIIASADTAMVSPHISANLRFGHESVLLPLSVLMELNNAGYETDDLSTLHSHWLCHEIFPMASNIQMVFYRRVSADKISPDDVLVKVLLNEAEATLPIDAVDGYYYRWCDLRKYYLDKLSAFPTRFAE